MSHHGLWAAEGVGASLDISANTGTSVRGENTLMRSMSRCSCRRSMTDSRRPDEKNDDDGTALPSGQGHLNKSDGFLSI